mgnify:CR=1 FL=1
MKRMVTWKATFANGKDILVFNCLIKLLYLFSNVNLLYFYLKLVFRCYEIYKMANKIKFLKVMIKKIIC